MTRRKLLTVLTGVGIALLVWAAIFLNQHPAWIGEQSGTSDYWHKAVGLVTDMPHATAELFYSMIDNLITWVVVVLIYRKWLARHDAKLHAQLDAEHGYEHDVDGDVHRVSP